MIKLTFDSTLNAIEFSDKNIKEIEDKFDVSIRKYVSYRISDDDDRQHWEDVNVSDFVCQRDGERHINIIKADRFQDLINEANNIEHMPEVRNEPK